MGGGGNIPYPKHVWSPSGGWYSRPSNWRSNTAIMFGVIASIVALTWKKGNELEIRSRMPDPDRVFPSRHWNKQIIEFESAKKARESGRRG